MHIKLEQGIKGCQIITDAYENDLASLEAVLRFMARQDCFLGRTLIIAPLEKVDLEDAAFYHQLAQLMQSFSIRNIIGIGLVWNHYIDYFDGINVSVYKDTAALLASGLLASLEREVIAIKNTRSLELASLAQQCYEKCHPTVLEVNLDAIQHNLQFFRNKLSASTQILAMAKALTYGSSDYEVAQLLEHCQVDYLAVAYTDEGVALRTHGICLPIMVMSPMPGSFHRLISYQLEPVIYSVDLLKSLQQFLLNEQVSMKVHIELETGMHRLGLEEADIASLIEILKSTSAMQPHSVMSQLAASSTPYHDAYTHTQAQLFQERAKQIETGLGIQLKKHLLNTGGILRFPAYQFDMVRLGIGLYGVGVDSAFQKELQVANRLKTTIIQIKQVPANATVGYERQGSIQETRTIATLAIGYADGLSRDFGNGRGRVWIRGQLAPIIGNVCMDMVMVDITHMNAQPGDEAIIFGPEYPIEQVAESAHTISYELLTQVGERVKRIYYTSK